MMRIRLWVGVLLLAVVLAGCRADCEPCGGPVPDGDGGDPASSVFAFTLCVSEVPRIERSDVGCGEVAVEYVVAVD